MPLYVATRKGLFTLDKTNGRWSVRKGEFLGDTVVMCLSDARDGSLYACKRLGHFGSKIHRSRDGGASWEECGVPAYPPQPEGVNETDGFGKPLPWKVDTLWALEAGHPSQPGVLWCGTIPGGLFHSKDSGDSWQLVESLWAHPGRKRWFGGGADLPGIHSICVDPRDGNHVTLGVSCGGVWVTRDAGATWNCQADGMWAAYMPPEQKNDPLIQDPHCVVECLAKPDHLWAQHHNGIFRSINGAQSWYEIKEVAPSTFGFAVAVHPANPDVAWFIPARSDEIRIPVEGRVVVTRTRDGGHSFDVLRNGLPQDHAYDLVFRHGLDVTRDGSTLAFGTTTGSVWVSEDQGDHWQAVSQHLPPVYCVRFAKR